jgi:hypothetical protein
MVAPGDGQVACALVAPEKAIAAAVSQGLFELERADAAREIGLGAEEVVRRQLQSEGPAAEKE